MKNALLQVAALALALAATPLAAREPIRIGWTAWSDGVFVTRLAARVIEAELDQPVELVRAGIAEQYQGIASGRLDAMLMSWQPQTHGPYIRRVAGRAEDLGALYTGGRLGWAVPAYVPRDAIASIADLDDAEVRERLGGRITGIEPASGLMRLSRRAVSAYGLEGYTLEPGGGPAMGRALTGAIEAGEWIVVTAWSPHWMFAAFDLRYLDDERGILGGSERVHALARPGFHADHPAVAELLGRMWLPRAELEGALLDAHEDSTNAAVTRYIEAHPDRIAYWVSGDH
ncbi:glycine betaine ABC transporter substrate-binding protein [Halofilum ochraceum]|uniref:glycine betaine ABC transporter substrate-binding protein n=1 Tax=Halofilum ochraceum TaxID=1611323 RepID=UPI00082CDC52|nr:glycine betaine ABC transporter substrate-binding protein [Halofilum ochraceum]